MILLKKTPLCVLISSLPMLSWSEAYSTNPVDEIVVTGTKTPVSLKDSFATVDIITQQDIARLQPADLPSLLQKVAGISVFESGGRGSVTSLQVRGMDTRKTLVLVDGVRVAGATSGTSALGSIPIESIERIEVVKGPLSSLYGADAVAGVIQIFTRRATDGLGGRIKIARGSFNARSVNASGYYGGDAVKLASTLNWERQSDFDRTDDNMDIDDDSFKEVSGSLSADVRLSEKLNWFTAYLRSDETSEYDNAPGDISLHFTDTLFENFSSKISLDASENINLTGTVGYFVDDSENIAYESHIKSQREMVGVQADIAIWAETLFTLGADYYSDNVSGVTGRNFSTGEFQTYEEDNRENSGVFVQVQQGVERAKLLGSLRYDDNEEYGRSVTGNAAVNVAITPSISIVPSYGTSFSAPTFNQLYWPGFGNPELLPEESQTFEVALKAVEEKYQWSIAYFDTEVENQILTSESRRATNVPIAYFQGVELASSFQWHAISVSANLSYTDAINAETEEYLADRPRLSGYVDTYYLFRNQSTLGLSFEGEHGRVGGYYGGSKDLGGYVLTNLYCSLSIADNFSIKLRVNNIFDKNYVVNLVNAENYYRTPGVNGELALELRF